jgi:hypothetical protein
MAGMALVRIRCGEPGCALPVRRADLDEATLALIDRGAIKTIDDIKPQARLCSVHKHSRSVDDDTAALMGTERLDGKTSITGS